MSNKPKKVCLITPNHIATNPRLVKEAIALEKAGFAVYVLFTQSIASETVLDKIIIGAHPAWTFEQLDWSGKDFKSRVVRLRSGILQKLAGLLFWFRIGDLGANLLINRNFYWQVKQAKKVNADLYIAHNLGALPVARLAAKQTGAQYGFDAEDFHRFESSDNALDKGVILKALVEQSNLPGVSYFTAASPLIGKAYKNLFPHLRPITVLNVFPKVQLKESEPCVHRLKMFWFSQTIGQNRGLENVLEAMGKMKTKSVDLYLLGNPQRDFTVWLQARANELNINDQLFIHGPVPEAGIFEMAATCHLGLACETGTPYNRDICLTNKIFTYIQAGLAVIASDTAAQMAFLNTYPQVGRLYRRASIDSLKQVLDYYYDNPVELQACRTANRQLAKKQLNWEVEEHKFINTVKNTLA